MLAQSHQRNDIPWQRMSEVKSYGVFFDKCFVPLCSVKACSKLKKGPKPLRCIVMNKFTGGDVVGALQAVEGCRASADIYV